jgi:hypothetical protein
MKFSAGTIAVLVLAAAAAPAVAQDSTSGTITIEGTVGDKCIVTDSGSVLDPDFGGLINLGQLDDTDGTLKDLGTFTASNNLDDLSFRIVCTTASPSVTVTAEPMVNPSVNAPDGYADTVHFTADANFSVVGGTDTYSVTTDATPSATGTLSDRLATGPDNVQIDLSNFHTPEADDVMTAGTYTGTVSITISPT